MEIKIRAWSNVENTMLSWFLIQQSAIPELIYKILVSDKNSFIPMLYAGLKDKNGVEIYEGDLLKVSNNIIYEIVFLLEDKYGETICSFGLKTEAIQFAIDHFAIKNGEIIGNIHQNPELLK